MAAPKKKTADQVTRESLTKDPTQARSIPKEADLAIAAGSQIRGANPENPEDWFDATVPSWYTNACLVRQPGVGGAATVGYQSSVLGAMANPTTGMVTAASHALNHAVVTISALGKYHTIADANTLNPDV
jgi:hypothetical protein